MSRLRREILHSALSATHPGDGNSRRAYRFDNAFIGFQGHFPGDPVLPAFVQVIAAQVSVEDHRGARLALRKLARARFSRIIRPGEEVEIHWEAEDGAAEIRAKVTIFAGEEKASSFVLHLGKRQMP